MKMEVVLSSPGHGHYEDDNVPYKNEEIHEWSGVDEITGMLENARVETGRWQAIDNNSAKSYGKVVDSRIRNSADGNIQQQARRQVEIYQSKEPGRSLQVVRASQWSSSKIKDIKNSELLTTKTFDTPISYESNKNTTNNYLQKRFNSDEDLILSSSSSLLNEPSTSSSTSSIFKRNSQTRRSLQLSKLNNSINDDNENSSIKINKKPQITVINLINPSTIYIDDDDNININKKTSIITLENNNNYKKLNDNNKTIKKVDFCKTEIHFAVDCGKVNIVETINKPPPTNKYRRKRRNNNSNNNNKINNNNLDINITNDNTENKSNELKQITINDDDNCGAYAVVDIDNMKYWNNNIHKTKIKLGDNDYIDDGKINDELTSPKAVLEINSRVKNINNDELIVTKDNDNNQVLSTIIKTHETTIARVEDNLPIIKKKTIDKKVSSKNDKKLLPVYANIFNSNGNNVLPIYENYRNDNDKKAIDLIDKNIDKKSTGIIDNSKKLINKNSYKFGKKTSGTSSTSGSKKIIQKDSSIKLNSLKKKTNDDSVKKIGTIKKPVEVVYKTAVYNMEKLGNNKLTKIKDVKKNPRIIDELICGSKNKNSKTINKRKGITLQGSKSATQPPRHWK